MAVSSCIDIKLIKKNNKQISMLELIQIFLTFGWNFSDDGKITYLPLGDQGDFNWITKKITNESLFDLLKEKERQNEFLGVCMTWQDTNIGGAFLIYENGTISISLNINRKIIDEKKSLVFTDVNWYLFKILPVFNENDYYVESFSYEEHI